MSVQEELALIVHNAFCMHGETVNCHRWRKEGSPHRAFYEERARNLVSTLEPEIGVANVVKTVQAVLDEVV